jgi:ribonuclease Z
VFQSFRNAGLIAATGLLLSLYAAQTPAQSADLNEFRVTLLGTGSPAPSLKRFGPGVLVQAGSRNLLFDCGRGAAQRLPQAGVRLGALEAVFLTHLHSDHTVGIPDLWLTGWLPQPVASRKGPFRIYGPAGTKAMMDNLAKAYDWDVRTRIADQKLAAEDVAIAVTEFAEGVVYDRDGLKVTAFEVDHGELVKPAFGFRIDYRGRSVVISGDTRPSENLIKHAAGTDLLIHEVAAASDAFLKKSPAVQLILAHHTRPEEAGTVFSRVKPKLAVLYHFSLLGAPGFPAPMEHEVFEGVRKTYAGPLVIGEDLMPFSIGKNGVSTRQ